MRSRRREIDPETARIIEQRLEHLLLEPPERSGPGRADPWPAPERTPRRARVDSGAEPAVGGRGSRMAEWDWPEPDPWPDPGSPPSTAGDGRPGRASTRALDELGPGVRRGGWRERWAAAALSRTHLGVVAVLAVLALLAAGWVVLRARPVAVATPLSVGSATADPTAAAPDARASTPTVTPKVTPSAVGSATPSPGPVVLHVLGAVRKPGLVRVAANARVADAVAAAGGLRRGADPDRLNLAATVVDGEQIFVGTAEHPAGEVRQGTGGGGTSSATDSPSSGSGNEVVDLNAASQTQLEELPGVGPVTAGKIIAWRSEHGRFSKVEELQEVSGIGPKTYAEIAPHCRV